MTIKDYKLMNNAAQLFDTRNLLLQQNGDKIRTSQSNADAKKSRLGLRKKLRFCMPKASACGSRARKAHLQEVCAYTSPEPKENIEDILQRLEISSTKSYLRSSETQVAKVDAGEAKKAVDVESINKLAWPRSLRKRSGFSMIKRWKIKKAGYYRALKWRTNRARDVMRRLRETKDMQKEDEKEVEPWKEMIAAKDGVQEDKGRMELCKKRILMGDKCRPLNLSGRLNYDKNGVFVPEDIVSLK